jgi:hypothetical protein
LHRDQFGFQKLVLVATGSGKLFALDSANGNIVWSRLIAFSGPNGSDLDVKAMWNVRDGSSGVGGPVVSILGERLTAKGLETVVLNVAAYTGMADGETAAIAGQPLGKVVFPGSHETAFLLPFENCSSKNKVLAIVDRDLQVCPISSLLHKLTTPASHVPQVRKDGQEDCRVRSQASLLTHP